MLQDQFVLDVTDDAARKRLLAEAKLTYTKAIEMGVVTELVGADIAAIRSSSTESSNVVNVADKHRFRLNHAIPRRHRISLNIHVVQLSMDLTNLRPSLPSTGGVIYLAIMKSVVLLTKPER